MKNIRILALLLIDAFLVAASIYLSYLLRFDFKVPGPFLETLDYVIPAYTLLVIFFFSLFKIYKRIWQYASIGDLISVFKGAVLGTVAFFLFHQFVVMYYSEIVVPRSVFILSTIIGFFTVGASRFVWRVLRDNYIKIQPHHRRVLVVGAGDAGIMVVRELKHSRSEYYPVAFIDDKRDKQHFEVMGIPVVGSRDDIPVVVKKYNIQDIIVAIPSASRVETAEILNICKETGCQIKMIPRVNDLINGNISIKTIRDVSVDDLLGRDPVTVDMDEIMDYLKGQVVLVTGAGGSIGSEICRQVANVKPEMLMILGHGENSIYDIELELRRNYPNMSITAIIADVQDRNRIEEVFRVYQPQVVFHAAAHKHVPLMEGNPAEAVKNNVIGTKNVAECADKYGSKRFVLVSTDKAVNPTSVMGATKRLAEMLVQNLDRSSSTIYSAVRFGNVLGSRGSVIPVFKKQIEAGGPVTVTHPDMVRYFMTIPEAVQLVIQAGAFAEGGEIFILDMGKPVKIADLAKDLVRLSGLEPNKDIEIVFTGIRPGEKLFEELLSKEEGATATKHDRIFVGKPLNVPAQQLVEFLDRFGNINDADDLKQEIKKLIPTYQWERETNKQIIKKTKRLVAATLDK